MEKTNANDLVNPAYINNGHDDRGYTHDGLTKREYFAAMAMQGFCANPETNRPLNDKDEDLKIALSRVSVKLADALIEQLNKPS